MLSSSSRTRIRTFLAAALASLLLVPGEATLSASGEGESSRPRVSTRRSGTGPVTAAVGTLPGDFVVDGNGAATYRIPIEVPPGTAGLEPQLTLSYSSQQKDGLLGVGWTLNGLSAIARCAATPAQDGFSGAVRFDSDDRFCLDGQRLMAVEGAYGEEGTVYNTERQSWIRVVSREECGEGPCWFEVRSKDGSVLEFGATDDARIAVGGSTVRIWALSGVMDTNGNTIEVRYRQVADPSYYVPDTILYTGHPATGRLPQRAVFFDYEGRSDLPTHFVAGSAVQLPLRLTGIETYLDFDGDGRDVLAEANLVRRLDLSYREVGERDISLLDEIQACAADGACLPSTSFTYTSSPEPSFRWLDSDYLGGWSNVSSKPEETHCTSSLFHGYIQFGCHTTHHKEQNATSRRFFPMELNGDGFTDFVEIYEKHGRTKARASIGRGDGTFSTRDGEEIGAWENVGHSREKRYYPMDLNLDGRSELVEIYKSGGSARARAWAWAESGFSELGRSTLGTWQDVTSSKASRFYSMDIDGDRLPDLVEIGESRGETAARIYRGDSLGAFDWAGSTLIGDWKDVGSSKQKVYIPIDFDSDGRGDLVELHHSTDCDDGRSECTKARVLASRSTPISHLFEFTELEEAETNFGEWEAVTSKKAHRFLPGDVNGDGLTDLIQIREGSGDAKARPWFSTGTTFVQGPSSNMGSWHDLTSQHVRRYYGVDADGDGLTDLIEIRKDGDDTHARVRKSGGATFESVSYSKIGSWKNVGARHEKRYYPMDVDGDGLPDIVELRRKNRDTQARTWRNGAAIPNLLSDVINGLGGHWSVSYGPLSDPDLYRVGTSAVYPEIDVLPPLYVVSSHEVSDTRSGTNRFDHRYEAARLDVSGYGWLGFAKTSVSDVEAGVTTETVHHQSFPESGLRKQTAVKESVDGDRIEVTEFTYVHEDSYEGVFRVRKQAEELSKFTDDVLDYRMKKRYEHDAYDNVVRIEDTGDLAQSGDELFACLEYFNSQDPWAVGIALSRRLTTEVETCDGPTWSPDVDLLWERFGYDEGLNRIWRYDYLYTPGDPRGSRWLWTQFQYDDRGNFTSWANPAGEVWRIEYDQRFETFPRRVTTPPNLQGESLTSAVVHDPAFGVPLVSIDPNGNWTSVVLDGFGRLVEQWGPDPSGREVQLTAVEMQSQESGASRKVRYRSAWTTDALDEWYYTTEEIDGFERTYRRTSKGLEHDRVEDRVFDSQGRLAKESYPYFEGDSPHYMTYDYDRHNHPIVVRRPDGSELRYEYSRGERETTTHLPDPRGSTGSVTFTTEVDSRGRLVEQIDPDGGVHAYEYDPLGRQVRVVDPLGVATTLEYDSLGRTTRATRPDLGETTFEYDDAGRLVRRADAKGQVVEYAYDSIGREVRKTDRRADGTVEGRTYFDYDDPTVANGIGRLTAIRMPGAVYGFSYAPTGESSGQRIEIGGQSYSLHRSWDPLGRLEALHYPDGSVLTPTYDEQSYLASLELSEAGVSAGAVTGAATTLATYEGYDVFGRAQEVTYGNGVELGRSFYSLGESLGRLEKLNASLPMGAGFAYQYFWNRAGKLSEIEDRISGERQLFAYDEMGRATSAAGAYGNKSYSYDRSGNLTNKDGRGFAYDPTSRHQLADSEGIEVEYDANGNLTRRRLDDLQGGAEGAVFEYRYDVENRLVEVVKDGASVLAFTYDVLGTRLTKTTADGTRVSYVTSAYEVVEYPDSRPTTYTKYADGPSGRVAAITREAGEVRLIAAMRYHEAKVAAEMASAGGFSGSLRWAFLRVRQALSHPALVASLPGVAAGLLMLAWMGLYGWITYGAARRRSWLGRLRRSSAAVLSAAGVSHSFTMALARGGATSYWRQHPALRRAIPVLALALLGSQIFGPEAAADLVPGAGGAGNPSIGTVFFARDHLTSTALVTDDEGEVVADLTYLPYGKVAEGLSQGDDVFRAKFTGKELDAESGLVYFGARYYDPELGRFLTADPAGQFDSPYLYAASDPVNLTDPDGEWVFLVSLVAGAIIGAYLGGVIANGSWNPAQWDWKSGKTYVGMGVGAAVGVAIVAGGAAVGSSISGGSVSLAGASAGTIAGTAIDVAFITYDTYRFLEDPTLENGLVLGLDLVGVGLAGRGTYATFRGVRTGKPLAHEGVALRAEERTSFAGKACRRSSFVAGTPVATADGLEPIESIEVDDQVWATDETSGRDGLYPVLSQISRKAPEVVEIVVEGTAIEATPEHPFHLVESGWREAAELEPGDVLTVRGGGGARVDSVSPRKESVAVFNFEVSEAHTYHVSEREVLVHNCQRRPKRAAKTAARYRMGSTRRSSRASLGTPPNRFNGSRPAHLEQFKVSKHQKRFGLNPGSQYVKRVRIKLTGSRRADNLLADAKAGIDASFRRRNGLTWHHYHDVSTRGYGTLFLMRTDVHGSRTLRHTGGVKQWEILMRKAYRG